MIEWTDEAQATLEQLRTGTNDELIEQTRILAEQRAAYRHAASVTRKDVLAACGEALRTSAFNSVYRGFKALSQPGVTFTPEQAAAIKRAAESNMVDAQQMILTRLAQEPASEPIPDLPADEAYARLMSEYGDVFEARRKRLDALADREWIGYILAIFIVLLVFGLFLLWAFWPDIQGVHGTVTCVNGLCVRR